MEGPVDTVFCDILLLMFFLLLCNARVLGSGSFLLIVATREMKHCSTLVDNLALASISGTPKASRCSCKIINIKNRVLNSTSLTYINLSRSLNTEIWNYHNIRIQHCMYTFPNIITKVIFKRTDAHTSCLCYTSNYLICLNLFWHPVNVHWRAWAIHICLLVLLLTYLSAIWTRFGY